jgi:uncharacterized protein (DUF433 family)
MGEGGLGVRTRADEISAFDTLRKELEAAGATGGVITARASEPGLTGASTLFRISVMDDHDRIVIEPQIRFGKPTVRGTRIAVGDVLSYLASGMSEDEILTDFPSLTRDDIRACLAYAAERERILWSIPAA